MLRVLSAARAFMFLSPLGERLGEGVNPETVSCITPSPSLSPKGERSMKAEVGGTRGAGEGVIGANGRSGP